MSDVQVLRGRPAPPQWDSLVAFANERLALSTPGNVWQAAAVPLYDEISAMEHEVLEENFYFALGGTMCGMVRAAQDPIVRDEVVDEASDAIVNHHFKMGAGRHDPQADLGLASLRSYSIGAPVIRLARKAHLAQPQAVRLLGDVIKVAVRDLRDPATPEEGESLRSFLPAYKNDILGGHALAGIIGANAFDTSVTLIWKALDFSDDEDFKSHRAVAAHDADKQAIAKIDLRKVAIRMGSVRLDEINDPDLVDRLVSVEDGQLVFHSDQLPKNPPEELPKNSKFAHHKRLRCPAISAHLIPFAAELTPRIILSAVHKVESRQAKA